MSKCHDVFSEHVYTTPAGQERSLLLVKGPPTSRMGCVMEHAVLINVATVLSLTAICMVALLIALLMYIKLEMRAIKEWTGSFQINNPGTDGESGDSWSCVEAVPSTSNSQSSSSSEFDAIYSMELERQRAISTGNLYYRELV
ncbi:uncharacterized protein [Asterias amurensis]|uniref:uncharacterized protein n=1 Tax=Asterias amurensis TaxID=7602 RepID=UPI003AB17E03